MTIVHEVQAEAETKAPKPQRELAGYQALEWTRQSQATREEKLMMAQGSASAWMLVRQIQAQQQQQKLMVMMMTLTAAAVMLLLTVCWLPLEQPG
jgi:hypothetical protein